MFVQSLNINLESFSFSIKNKSVKLNKEFLVLQLVNVVTFIQNGLVENITYNPITIAIKLLKVGTTVCANDVATLRIFSVTALAVYEFTRVSKMWRALLLYIGILVIQTNARFNLYITQEEFKKLVGKE